MLTFPSCPTPRAARCVHLLVPACPSVHDGRVLDHDVTQALKAAGVVWVVLDGHPPRVLWHLWHDGCVWTVVGGAEQELPGLRPGPCEVVVRGPQRQALPPAPMELSVVEPGTELWAQVTPLLHAARLNPVDGPAQPERWARESTVVRLEPRAP